MSKPHPCVNLPLTSHVKDLKRPEFFERLVESAPKLSPLSKAFHHFCNVDAKQCCELKPFLKPHWYLHNILSKN